MLRLRLSPDWVGTWAKKNEGGPEESEALDTFVGRPFVFLLLIVFCVILIDYIF